MLISNISNGFVTKSIVVTERKIIPFSFSSSNQEISEKLSVKGLNNVKIKNVHVDNGDIEANIDGSYIWAEFYNGEWRDEYRSIYKIDTVELTDAIPVNNVVEVIPKEKARSIKSISGDFGSAKVNSKGNIELEIKDTAKGIKTYDKNTIEKSLFTVNIGRDNTDRQATSKVVLEHEVKGDIIPKYGDTSKVYGISSNKNEVEILFDEGVPFANENYIKSGHTFFWIDRFEDGTFQKYNPNSVYASDISKISGLGKYIDEREFDEIGTTVTDNKWRDYCGIEKNGVRYIYVFDEDKGIPTGFEDKLLKDGNIEFDEQNFNSEKYTVEFSKSGVSYIPEGKLYSVGELVSNTKGWGEISPNKSWESQKTFFNKITGKNEAYVRHFKFFYGPKEKVTFGGYYTYPYSCTFEYEHYKPVVGYSGEVVYEYESKEKVKGYSYNGWIEIEYQVEKDVNDYPPTEPFNARYNFITGNITWEHGNDDYTPQKNLKYEIEVYEGSWKSVVNECFGNELIFHYPKAGDNAEIRICTIDENNQKSEWTYLIDDKIEVSGEVIPYIVNPGDEVDIFSKTKSFSKIKNVIAKNDEMQMYVELDKTGEYSPEFCEISYDIEANFPEYDTESLVVTNGRVAKGSKEEINAYNFAISEEFTKGSMDIGIIEDIKISKNGTIIFSNLNYDPIPVNMFSYASKTWFVSFDNKIYIKNKLTNKDDVFLGIENDTNAELVNNRSVIVPKRKIRVNKFKYDSTGAPEYQYIDVDKKYLSNPISVTWNTDVYGVTNFYIYSASELIYTYTADWEDINKHVDNFESVYMYKQMKKFVIATYGYITPSKNEKAKWNKIVLSIANNHDLRDFIWLGYRVKKNEYVNEKYIEEYNNNPNVRNNYRLLFVDTDLSKKEIKKYVDILKTKNISMRKDKNAIYGDDAITYTSTFEGKNIKIPDDASSGMHVIELIATDVEGNVANTNLNLIVERPDETDEEKNDEVVDKPEEDGTIEEAFLGRFFYRDEKGYLEELKKLEDSDNYGFICAGETLGIVMLADNVEYIEVDFVGDNGIKQMDKLTEKFLINDSLTGLEEEYNIREMYSSFPQKIYPQYVDNQKKGIFKWFYIIPYKTNQSLASWSTLKNSTLENIDTSRLFERIRDPYELVIYVNGDRKSGIHMAFDVFERWDTVMNRDISENVINSGTKWEMRIDK